MKRKTDLCWKIMDDLCMFLKIWNGQQELTMTLRTFEGLTLLDIAKNTEKRGVVMRLKNILIVVEDIERSKQFYHDLFGLDMVLDNDGNMILTEGLVLQDREIWEKFLEKDIIPESNACELYFEERDIESFAQKLEKIYPSVKYVNRLTTHSWGEKVIRFYDPDGNLIEVGTPK